MQHPDASHPAHADAHSPLGRRRYPGFGPLLAVVIAAGAAYWYFYTPKELRFREQVQLPQGPVVDVTRLVRALPYTAIGGGGWTPLRQSLWIHTGPQSVAVAWESAEGLAPVLLDRDAVTGQWLVVAAAVTCEAWYELGKPRLPYAEFRLAQGRWLHVPLSAQALGRDTNITTSIRFGAEADLLTLADKAQRRLEPHIPAKYLVISDRWSTGC